MGVGDVGGIARCRQTSCGGGNPTIEGHDIRRALGFACSGITGTENLLRKCHVDDASSALSHHDEPIEVGPLRLLNYFSRRARRKGL